MATYSIAASISLHKKWQGLKKTAAPPRLLSLGDRKVSEPLSTALKNAIKILWQSKKKPSSSEKKIATQILKIETVIAAVQYCESWFYVVKWSDYESITLMRGGIVKTVDTYIENRINNKNYINATNLFDLPSALVSYEAVRIVIGDLYNVYGEKLCQCPFPQVTDREDGDNWYYIPDYVTPEACLRLHVALIKVWGTPSTPMTPDTPMLMPSIFRVR